MLYYTQLISFSSTLPLHQTQCLCLTYHLYSLRLLWLYLKSTHNTMFHTYWGLLSSLYSNLYQECISLQLFIKHTSDEYDKRSTSKILLLYTQDHKLTISFFSMLRSINVIPIICDTVFWSFMLRTSLRGVHTWKKERRPHGIVWYYIWSHQLLYIILPYFKYSLTPLCFFKLVL